MELDKIYLGDCLEVMSEIESKSIDMILCDLPYGTTRCAWDSLIDLSSLWGQYRRVIKDNGAIVLFAQTPFDKVLGASALDLLRYEWIWEKTQATGHYNAKVSPLKAHENILVFYKNAPTYNPQMTYGHEKMHGYNKTLEQQNKSGFYGKATKFITGGGETSRYPRDVLKFKTDKQTNHLLATQKPVLLMEYLIKTYSNEGELILDNCIGSGTTAVACLNTNRRFIGIEKDKNNYNIAVKRINNSQEQLNMF